MKPSIIALFFYGLVLLFGGAVGYFKSGSLVSLILGLIFGSAILISALGYLYEKKWGLPFAYSMTLLSCFIFLWRYVATWKMMPAGMLLILGLISLICLSYEVIKNIIRRG